MVYFYLMCIMKVISALNCDQNICAIKQIDKRNNRNERALLFPPSSTIGVSCNANDFILLSNNKKTLISTQI